MNYFIDAKIISMFLNQAIDSDAVVMYLQKYSEKLASLSEKAVKHYLSEEKKMSDEQIEAELDKLGNFETYNFEESPLLDQGIMDILGKLKMDLDKQIYEYYRVKLTEEQKNEVNLYIAGVEQDMVSNAQEERKIALEVLKNIEEEYNRTGTIRSADEVEADNAKKEVTEEDLMSIEKELEEELGKTNA